MGTLQAVGTAKQPKRGRIRKGRTGEWGFFCTAFSTFYPRSQNGRPCYLLQPDGRMWASAPTKTTLRTTNGRPYNIAYNYIVSHGRRNAAPTTYYKIKPLALKPSMTSPSICAFVAETEWSRSISPPWAESTSFFNEDEGSG